MIPRLFKPDATDFNAVGYGPITTTIRATVTEELNQAPVLEMELLVTDPLLDTIIVGSIIAAKPNAVDPVQAFVVEEITKPLDGVIRIYAPHIAQHRAQLLILFTPLNIVGLDNVFAQLSRKTATLPMNNPFKFVRAENKTDAARRLKIDTPRTLRETMGGTEGSIIDVFSGEWAFDNFTCTLYSKRGRESGARVLYGRNMTDFNLDEFYDFNLDMSATGCVGWGQYEEDGTTKTIIGDLQVSDNAFDVFPYIRAAAVDFSEGIKYQHTKELVNNLAKAWLRVRGAIGTTAEVAFNHIDGGEDIGMGDTIRIYNNVYNYEARSRVVGLRYDVIAETYESVTIGDQRATLSEAIQDTAGGGSYSYSSGGGSSVDPSTTLPIMDGTASVGTEQTYARGDHRHPTDTTRVSVAEGLRLKGLVSDYTTDFDNLKSAGLYKTNGTTMSNPPPSGYTWSNVIVLPIAGDMVTQGACTQIVIGNNGVIWQRKYTGDPLAWSSWMSTAKYLQDSNTSSYTIQVRYGGSGLTDVPEWLPIYNNLGNNLIEMSPVSKHLLAKSCVREYNQDINWTLRADGGVYAYSFNTFNLFGISSKHIINIGMSSYTGSWRYLNFYPYGANDWVVISNQSSLSGRIKILYF